MTTPNLAFLWHMHQPFYRNIISGECVQPWVRLHGIHSYYDMMKLYERHPDVHVNINFVPSLLRQLRNYAEDGLSDKFLDISRIDAKELTHQDKVFILRNFFVTNPERMIKPHPRYWKLFNMRGTKHNSIDYSDATRYFSWRDYLDMQVYFNLVWFGFVAREEFPELDRMLSIQSSAPVFTEDDKKTVLNAQHEVLKRLLNLIRNTPPNIELTTTPYFHPITPLVIDTDIAKRCMPGATLPERFSAPQHAEFQIKEGVKFFEESTGKKPNGMWPSEGSVCPEMIPILESAGIKWMATDEGNLFLSGVTGKRADVIYQPYSATYENSSVDVVFRDRELSDLIGFNYYRMPAKEAVADLLAKIKSNASASSLGEPLVTILMDGENAWEAFENHGKEFLTTLLDELSTQKELKTTTITNYLEGHRPSQKIAKLHSGSWINSNFAIWIGKEQKNKAWGYIKRTHDELGQKLSAILAKERINPSEKLALESFAAGCGSDWFWWFDDDFQSEFKGDFDKIFRMHLKNVYSLFGRDIPVFLYDPIFKYTDKTHHAHGEIKPCGFIRPALDGRNSSFFEWTNSVKIDVGTHSGPMGQTNELIESIYFGFNESQFFIRLDPIKKYIPFTLSDSEEVVIYLHDSDKKYKMHLFFDGEQYRFEFIESPEEGYIKGEHKADWAVQNVFEMGLSYADLGFVPNEKITVILTVVRKGLEVRHYSHMTFSIPNDNYEQQMWTV